MLPGVTQPLLQACGFPLTTSKPLLRLVPPAWMSFPLFLKRNKEGERVVRESILEEGMSKL